MAVRNATTTRPTFSDRRSGGGYLPSNRFSGFHAPWKLEVTTISLASSQMGAWLADPTESVLILSGWPNFTTVSDEEGRPTGRHRVGAGVV